MLEERKQAVEHLLKSVYEKVYIVNFEFSPFIPSIEEPLLAELGKWYVSTGKEWICHSDLKVKEFEALFLNLLTEKLRKTVRFEVDYLPFQQV